jgi:hypothetical protein
MIRSGHETTLACRQRVLIFIDAIGTVSRLSRGASGTRRLRSIYSADNTSGEN